jgi:hypothetical protein
MRVLELNYASKLFIWMNPFLFISTIATGTVIRKEWFFLYLLLLHTYWSLRLANGELVKKRYFLYLVFLVIFFNISLFMHELTLVTLPLHLYIFFTSMNVSSFQNSGKIRILLFAILQTLIIALIFFNHGSPEASIRIYRSIPTELNVALGVIQSNGWSFSENFRFVLGMIESPPTLIVYALAFLIGPVLLYGNLFTKKRPVETFLYFIPLMLIFFSGEDWGRWISILSFVTLSFVLIERRNQLPMDGDTQNSLMRGSPLIKNTLAVFLIGIILMIQLSVVVPHCCQITSRHRLTGPIPIFFYEIFN